MNNKTSMSEKKKGRAKWANYPADYRNQEISTVANWIISGKSGSVVGLPGSGKSNFYGFLCHRREVTQAQLEKSDRSTHQSIVFVPVDLNHLVDRSHAFFYRLMLRSCLHVKDAFPVSIADFIVTTFQEYQKSNDSFLTQTAIYDLISVCEAADVHLTFVFDRFDNFYEFGSLPLANSLRAFRDGFKDHLSYLMFSRQPILSTDDPEQLGELREIIDTNVCWIGAMSESDARFVLKRELGSRIEEQGIIHLLTLTGNYPALLRAAASWWEHQNMPPPHNEWLDALLAHSAAKYRLKEIVDSLSQAELFGLNKILQTKQSKQLKREVLVTVRQMERKGLVYRSAKGAWDIPIRLLAHYIRSENVIGLGKIWLNTNTNVLYQGDTPIRDLTPLEINVLTYLLECPERKCTKTEIIENAWPFDKKVHGVSDDSLFQVIRGLRKKIEPSGSRDYCYLLSAKGGRESGYQLFPDGNGSAKR